MDKLLDIIEEESSVGEVKEKKLRSFLFKVMTWDYAKINQNEYQNLSKSINFLIIKL